MSLLGMMKQKTVEPEKAGLLKKKPSGFSKAKPSGLMAKLTGKC